MNPHWYDDPNTGKKKVSKFKKNMWKICGNMQKDAEICVKICRRTNSDFEFSAGPEIFFGKLFGTLPGFWDFPPYGSTSPITRKAKGEATGREATGLSGPTMLCKAIYALFVSVCNQFSFGGCFQQKITISLADGANSAE